MGIRNEEFGKGRDIFIDYPTEKILIRFTFTNKKYYSKNYGSDLEIEVGQFNSVIRDAVRFGDEINIDEYNTGK